MLSFKRRLALFLVVSMVIIFNYRMPMADAIETSASQLELTVTGVTGSNITLKWSAMPGVWKYRIFRSNSQSLGYTLIATTSSPKFTDQGLDGPSEYWYYVKAHNNYGISFNSGYTKANVVYTPRVLGFSTHYYAVDNSSYTSLINNSSIIDDYATYTYTTDGSGNISGTPPAHEIAYANSKGVKTLALVTNNFNGDTAKTLLESPGNRQRLISNILSVLKTNNYKGVNIDIEGIYYYDRNYFTSFMDELYKALQPEGLEVTVDIPAKTWDDPTNSWSGAYDYSKIANSADRIIIMTYDEHFSLGSPGPIASIGWVSSVVDYATSLLKPEKIMLGTAAYGYDWSSKGSKAYGIDAINNLAKTYGKQIQWDPVSKTPFLYYTDSSKVQHTVWFENSTSLKYKLDLVKSKNLGGIAIWKLGLENSDYWGAIKSVLK